MTSFTTTDTLPRVSIIIPVRNEEHHIGRMLREVLGQHYPSERMEVLVIDGASDDNTCDVIRAVAVEVPGISLQMLHNERGIVPVSLNIGLAAASGDVMLRMDAHTEYANDYVRCCVEALLRTGADNVGGPVRTRAELPVQRAIAAAFHSPFSAGGARFHDVEAAGNVDTVPYGCWWRQRLLDLGGFDEELVRNQDDELNLRIIRAGGRVWLDPTIRSWYHPRTTLGGLFRQYLQYGYWKVRVIRRHGQPASIRHLVPALFVLGLLLGAVVGAFSPLLLQVWLGSLLAYLILLIGFSVATSLRSGLSLFPLLLVVFPVFHISYGLGFLTAAVREIFVPSTSKARASNLFTTLSR